MPRRFGIIRADILANPVVRSPEGDDFALEDTEFLHGFVVFAGEHFEIQGPNGEKIGEGILDEEKHGPASHPETARSIWSSRGAYKIPGLAAPKPVKKDGGS